MNSHRLSTNQVFMLLLALAVVLLSAIVYADDAPAPIRVRPASAAASTVPVISPGEVAATPEMWFYQQAIRRYDDPKNAVRAAAEYKAAQRRARMAAMQWYGYSNSRPTAGIDPVHGPLQPQWIGNGYNPFTWVGPNSPTVVVTAPAAGRGY